MPRLIAFLRAVNVGGHVVKMSDLRELFESLGFAHVETFIASGNVVFETRAKNAKTLEKKIETTLRVALGYDVTTFIRSERELAEIANYQPFSQSDLAAAAAHNIAFLADPLDAHARERLMALRSDADNFAVHEREIYWLSRGKQSDSIISNAVFEKTLGQRSTVRGVNTIKKLAAKYCTPQSK